MSGLAMELKACACKMRSESPACFSHGSEKASPAVGLSESMTQSFCWWITPLCC